MTDGAGERGTARDVGAVDREHPWPGLAAFREEDRAFFFGREGEVEELRRLVVRRRSTVLFGLSGLGKTSLLQAGLFPLVRADGLLPVYLRLDHADARRPLAAQVKEALARTAAQADVEAPRWSDPDTLWEIFHRQDSDFWSHRNRPVIPLLVLDQFEELFTVGRRSAEQAARSASFLEELGDLVEGRPPAAVRSRLEGSPEEALQFGFGHHPYKVLIALREDFVPDLEDLGARVPSLLQNRMRLQRMDGAQGMQVVVGAGGDLITRDVAERIVRFIGSAASDETDGGAGREAAREGARKDARDRELHALEVEPALLSVVCRELNNRRLERGDAAITADLIAGSRAEILAGFYERSFAGLPASVRDFVEEHLLTVSGFRDSVALENVLADPRVPRGAIDRLVDRRLLRIEERSGVERVELAHDVLTGVVRASRDAARAQRELQAARERAEAEREEAIERERKTRAELRRARRQRTVLLVVVALAIFALVRAYMGERRALTTAEAEKQARVTAAAYAAAYYELEANLRRPFVGERADEALAYLAAGVRFDPGNAALRGMLLDLLLHLPRPLPSLTVGSRGPGEAEGVRAFAFSPDGERIITVSADDVASTWDSRTGALIGRPTKRRPDPPGQSRDDADAGNAEDRSLCPPPETGVTAFTRDGSLVFTNSRTTPHVWDTRTGTSVELVRDPSEGPRCSRSFSAAAFSPDGERLVTGSPDGVARIWDARTGAPMGQPMVPPPPGPKPHQPLRTVVSVTFSPDGERVVTGYEGQRTKQKRGGSVTRFFQTAARLWDARSGAPLGKPMRHSGRLRAVTFSRDGAHIVALSDAGAYLWDGHSGAFLGRPLRPEGTPPHRMSLFGRPVAVSPDGRRIAIAASDTVRVWDASSEAPIGVSMKHDDEVTAVAFSPDGERILAASYGTARVWDVESGALVGRPIEDADGFGGPTAFTPDGERIVTLLGGSVRLWNIDQRSFPPIDMAMQHEGRVLSVASSPDGDRVLTTSSDGVARLWDARSGAPAGDPMQHDGATTAAAFSPDGERVVTASEDGTARLWDGRSGARIGQPMQHDGAVDAVAFSPDGQRIVTGSRDRTAHLWDGHTGTPIGQPMEHKDRILAVAFQPDGERLVTMAAKGTNRFGDAGDVARLWDARSGAPVREPVKHASGEPTAIVFSPNGERVATAARTEAGPAGGIGPPKHVALLWDYGPHVFRYQHDGSGLTMAYRTLLHDGVVEAIAFSPDGTRVVTASADHAARLWDVESGAEIGRVMQHDAAVRAVAFSPDGERVVTGSSDRTARVWDGRTGASLGEPRKHDDVVVAVAFGAGGESIITASGKAAHVWAAPSGSREDADLIARLAEATGGLRMSASGRPVPVGWREDADSRERMAPVRDWLADPAKHETGARAAVRWLLSDPRTRTIAPGSTVAVTEYIESRLGEGTPEALADLQRRFPGHPLLRAAPPSSR